MGGGGSNTSEKDSTPWAGQQPYLTDIFNQAQNQYRSSSPTYFPGQTVAPQSQQTQQALTNATGAATGSQTQIAQDAAQASNYDLTKAIDVNNNPQLNNAILAAQRPVVQQFTDPGGPLAQIRSNATAAGGYGGSRQGIAEGVAAGRLGDTLGGISSQMASDAYYKGLQAQNQALALAPQTQAAQVTPATTLGAVGGQVDAYQQSLIDAAIQKYNYEQTIQQQKLAQYQNLIQGNFGGSTISTGPSAKGNPVLGGLGGAATGAGLAGALISSGAINGWNPYGWAAMAAGGLIGALGSS